VVGNGSGNALAEGASVFFAQALDEHARIHARRAARAAQAVCGAGGLAHVFVALLQRFQLVAIRGNLAQAADFAVDSDALARRERQIARGTDRFAESAFHALVHQFVGGVQGLEIFEMPLRIAVEQHAGVEDVLGVEQAFDALHDGVGLAAPLQLHKGRNVAASAVFRLERTVVLFRNQLAEVFHESLVAGHFCRSAKVLPENKVQVAVARVAEERGHRVAVAGKKILQVFGGLAQPVEGEGHVFNDNGGAHGPHAAHRGQNALADEPQLGEFLGFVGKGVGPHKGHVAESRIDGGNVLFKLFVGGCAGFHKQGTDVVVQGFQPFGQAGGAFHRAQGRPVHKLRRSHGQGCHGRGQITGGLDRGQEQQGRGLEGGLLHRAVSHFGNKTQRAFGADHDML